jgi:hypothetical protein
MSKNNQIVVDLTMIEDVSQALIIMFEIISAKKSLLTDDEIERLQYVNKLMLSSNKIFQNAKPFDNE